jgi:hypothetical protein
MRRKSILHLVVIVLETLLIIGGALLWGLGNKQDKYFRTELMVSVPLCPESGNRTCDYVGKNLDKCSAHDPLELELSLAASSVLGIKKDQKVFLVHNIWNYNFSVDVYDSSKTNVIFHSFSRKDSQADEESAKERGNFMKEVLPGEFFEDNRFWISCPKPTLITRELGLEPGCNSTFGSLTRASDTRFETIELGFINYEKAGTDAFIVFKDLRVTPRDYVEIPQLFWASCTENKRREALQIAGITLTSFGCLGWVDVLAFWITKREATSSE